MHQYCQFVTPHLNNDQRVSIESHSHSLKATHSLDHFTSTSSLQRANVTATIVWPRLSCNYITAANDMPTSAGAHL